MQSLRDGVTGKGTARNEPRNLHEYSSTSSSLSSTAALAVLLQMGILCKLSPGREGWRFRRNGGGPLRLLWRAGGADRAVVALARPTPTYLYSSRRPRMTSYQIAAHVGRTIHPSWTSADGASSSINGSAAADQPTADRSTAAATSAQPTASSSSSSSPAAQSATTALGAGRTPLPLNYDASCAFCRIVKGQGKGYIVWEDDQTIAFLGACAGCPPVASGS